jgi:hypothetical protein
MSDTLKTKAKYNTWIRINKLLIFLGISLTLLLIAVLPVHYFLRVFSGILALPFIYISFLLSYYVYHSQPLGGTISLEYMI